MITISTSVDLLTLNMLASISNALGFTLGPAILTITMMIMVSTKDQPIFIKNGIS
jgi:hypothetical protein